MSLSYAKAQQEATPFEILFYFISQNLYPFLERKYFHGTWKRILCMQI
jgi:hypothetical protein